MQTILSNLAFPAPPYTLYIIPLFGVFFNFTLPFNGKIINYFFQKFFEKMLALFVYLLYNRIVESDQTTKELIMKKAEIIQAILQEKVNHVTINDDEFFLTTDTVKISENVIITVSPFWCNVKQNHYALDFTHTELAELVDTFCEEFIEECVEVEFTPEYEQEGVN